MDGKDKMKSSRFQNLQAQAHLCPVTKEIFRKYTNIDQIAESYCKKMYSDVKRYCCTQISRFYLIFYLMPNLRTSRPLSKLKILPNCPDDIKEKILEIPKHLQQENHANNNIPSSVNKDVSHTNITSESHVDRAEDVITASKENENNAQTTSSQAIAIESVNTLSAASTSRHETKILKNVQGLSSSKEGLLLYNIAWIVIFNIFKFFF